jgi:hypothetical protein
MPTYKILGQVAPSSANTNTDLYAVPAGSSAVISTISITNTSASTTGLAEVYVRKATSGTPAATATSNALVYEVGIASNGVTTFTLGVTVTEYDTITVQSSVANILTFHAFGSEI